MSTTPPPGPGNPGGSTPGQFQSVYGGGTPPPQPPPMGAPQMGPPPIGPGQPRKGLGPLGWVLIIIGGLFALFVIFIVAIGLFVMHKAKQAGIDPALMQKNPALAAAKMMVAVNPDYEIASEDDNHGTVTIREKKTGKTMTMNASDIRNGRLTFKGDQDQTVTFGGSGNGAGGSFEVKSNDGTARFGSGPVNLPSWLPNYPGSKPEATASSETREGSGAVFSFRTDDAPDKVIDFYRNAFSTAGLKESANVNTPGMNMVAAKNDTGSREVNVMITKDGAANLVHVTYSDKK